MIFMSLLPIGLIQVSASINRRMWYAKSLEVMQSPMFRYLRWLRIVGDVIFAVGALYFAETVIDKIGQYTFHKGSTLSKEDKNVR